MTKENIKMNPDPFLLSQSILVTGSGKALVCCVGANSRRGILDEKLDTTSKTPLQIKLDNLGARFTKWGIIAAIAIFIASGVRLVILCLANDLSTGLILNYICTDVAIAITIIIVAVPEGLPLTIALSLAYSTTRMIKDGVLIKNLNSPEIMGQTDEICTGKTTTMTKGEFKLAEFFT